MENKVEVGKYGVFADIAEACDAAAAAQKDFAANYTLADRQKFIEAVQKVGLAHLEELCKMEREETGYGRYEDKLQKNFGAIALGEGVSALPKNMYTSSDGLTVEYYAPFGLIGAITPVTNPVATVIGNGISNLAAGNSIVFNPHPAAKHISAYTLQLVNKAIVEAGGPDNLLVCPAEPTMETLDVIMKHPDVHLIVGTGGPAMVKTLMASGKKVIAAGPGNPPSIIDETAPLEKAAAGLLASSSFDNNLLCIAEKEVFVVDAVFDAFMEAFEKAGAMRVGKEEGAILTENCLIRTPDGGYAANKKFVGKNANVIMEACGLKCEGDPRIVFFEAENDDPLVQTEQMMPILPIVRCKDFEEAKQRAYFAEHGNRHSASIWSCNSYRVTEFGKIIGTTIFVQNGGTMAAFGIGGSGTNSPTIATPTGDGVTGPQSFVRRRRFCMADGINFLL